MNTAHVLFQTAQVGSGYEIADPSAILSRVHRLMPKELGVDPAAALEDAEVHDDDGEKEAEEKNVEDDAEGVKRAEEL